MYKITKEQTKQSNGRFAIVRNVYENGYKHPYVAYHIMIENDNKYCTIELNRKRKVTYASELIEQIASENNFKNVQEFADYYKRDFRGFVE